MVRTMNTMIDQLRQALRASGFATVLLAMTVPAWEQDSTGGIASNRYIVNRAALYIDGIPFHELSNAVLSRIDSTEVLRGPQSTLYGTESEAGLLIINSRQSRTSATRPGLASSTSCSARTAPTTRLHAAGCAPHHRRGAGSRPGARSHPAGVT